MTILRRRSRRRTRGAALLLVLIVLILIATLATEIALSARTHYRLATHSMNDFLLRSVVEGRSQILRAALRYDLSLGATVDTEDETWSWHKGHDTLCSWGTSGSDTATSSIPGDDANAAKSYKNKDVQIVAWCEDERSKLNLRGLLWEEDTPTFKHTREALVRLIDVYREKYSELDVIDSDGQEMVNDLVDWLRDIENSDEDPNPPVKTRVGRVLSLEDLLRVPGGRWTAELCYDVRNPKLTAEGDFSRGVVQAPAEVSSETTETTDDDYQWKNGSAAPGLFRYLTLWGEGSANTPPRININTALYPVLAAMFEPGQEDYAESILQHRRTGGSQDSSGSSSTGGSSGTGGTASADVGSYFTQKSDLTKVEGLGDDLTRYPRLDFFAETKTTVFSLRVIASLVSGRTEGDEESGEEGRDLTAAYQYREVVQRSAQGIVSLFAERRQDPILPDSE